MGQVTQALERRRNAKVAEREARVAAIAKAQHVPAALSAAASAIPLDGTGWKNWKLGDLKWQKEAWHHYDLNGDLRFIANWVGNACSRSRIYIAEIDPTTGKPGKEATDPEVAALAETVFGGPAAKAEALRLLGIHLFVPGESYIVAEAVETAEEDRWYVVSTSDIKREGDKDIVVRRPQEYGGGDYKLRNGTDLLIRVWTPHPRKYDLADSSVRPGLVPLREIEQLTKYEFAQIDSRLAGNGVVLMPQEIDFPKADGDPEGMAGLTAVIQRAMATALANREDPSSLVPIFIEVAAEHLDKIKHLTFESPLNDKVPEMQERATRKLARCLDVDPEILIGKGESNHWTAWQIEESTIRLFVGNPLARICDALTNGYLRAALGVLGEGELDYCFWYDTSALTVTPDRQKDSLELHEKGLLSDQAVRAAGSWSEDQAPSKAEQERRMAWDLVKLDPSKITVPDVQKALGIEWEFPAAAAEGADQTDNPDVPGGGSPNPSNVRGLPERQQPTDRSRSTQAAALLVGAHMAVQRTLELAGKRLLTRENRGKYADVAAFDLHTQIKVMGREHAETLVDDALGDLSVVSFHSGIDGSLLRDLVGTYCTELVSRGIRHQADLLTTYLTAGLHAACDELGFCEHPEIPGACTEDMRQAFHLPGRHDQKTHGHRRGVRRRSSLPGIGPLTETEKVTRSIQRSFLVDPDQWASAEDRQGRRAWAAWQEEARMLTRNFVGVGRAQVPEMKVDAKKKPPTPKTAAEVRAVYEQTLAQLDADLAEVDKAFPADAPIGFKPGKRAIRTPKQKAIDAEVKKANTALVELGRPALASLSSDIGMPQSRNSSKQWIASQLVYWHRLKKEPARDDTSAELNQIVRGRDLTDTVAEEFRRDPDAYRSEYGVFDKGIQGVGMLQGFDGSATVLSTREFDEIVKRDGVVEIHRGVKPPWTGGKTVDDILDTLRSGPYEPGNGIYGNGYYFSVNEKVAIQYGRTKDSGGGKRLRAAIKPGAKFIDYEEALGQHQAELDEWRRRRDIPKEMGYWGADFGRWLTVKGYDGYTVNGKGSCCERKQRNRGKGSYNDSGCCRGDGTEYKNEVGNSGFTTQYVVLNRTAIYVEDVNRDDRRTAEDPMAALARRYERERG